MFLNFGLLLYFFCISEVLQLGNARAVEVSSKNQVPEAVPVSVHAADHITPTFTTLENFKSRI